MNTRWSLIAAIILFTGFVSCKDEEDEPACSAAWSTELQAELNAVTNAAMVYGNDPSQENCVAFQAAYDDYIDALEPYGDCSALTGQARTDFNAALQAARDNREQACD